MNESARIQELQAYKILDTLPEQELDELAEVASAICDTPYSLISFIDEARQWFKVHKGLAIDEIPRRDSLCLHTMQLRKEVLVVDDLLQDARFKNNRFVLDNPHLRFYAGVPLETPEGQVLGTLCILDNQPRHISETQKKALQLLAKRVMDYLESRKRILEQEDTIESNAAHLRKLSDQAPGAIYQLKMRLDGTTSFSFISNGITVIHPALTPAKLKENAALAYQVVHPDDLESVRSSLRVSYQKLTNWSIEYRVIGVDGKVYWHWANAKPEKQADGTVVWYGTFQDITPRKEYIHTLEQILFDISHVMRRPVANLLGLTAVLTHENLDEKSRREFIGHIRTVSQEMDEYTRKLNGDYYEAMLKVTNQGVTMSLKGW